MPLMTKILKPERFTAETLADYMLVGAELSSVPAGFVSAELRSAAWLRVVVIDAAQFALDQMRAQRIIGE